MYYLTIPIEKNQKNTPLTRGIVKLQLEPETKL